MLFGDRVPADVLVQAGLSRYLTGDRDIYSELLGLANRISVKVTGAGF
jgi:hypothetical protein